MSTLESGAARMATITRHPELGLIERRLRWLAPVMIVVFALLGLRLFEVQVLRHEELTERARENLIQTVFQPGPRGTIRGAGGEALALDRPAHDLYLTPASFENERFDHLCRVLELDTSEVAELRAVLDGSSPRAESRHRLVLIAEDLDRDQVAQIETSFDARSGVTLRSRAARQYPLGAAAAHVLGYVNEIGAEELLERRGRGYRQGDRIGRMGIERAFEEELRGRSGWSKTAVDARGRPLPENFQRAWVRGPRRQDPAPGEDLVLTIDASLQRLAERGLSDFSAAGVVAVEVDTGRLLVAVSKPGFDPEAMAEGLTATQMTKLLDDPLDPFFNRPLMGLYPPGTPQEALTALAALGEEGFSPRERERCRGSFSLGERTFRCSSAHGVLNLSGALAESCDVYFYHLAERPGMMEAIAWQATQLGLGERTGLGLQEATGRVDSRLDHPQPHHVMSAAVGQGQSAATALQMVMAYAALANGGVLLQPQVVRRVEAAGGELIREVEPRVRRHMDLSPINRDLLIEALVDAAQRLEGDRQRSPAFEGVEVAGTGDEDWFVGFAPAQAPRFAVAVVIERGARRVESAAAVALELFDGLLRERRQGPLPASRGGE